LVDGFRTTRAAPPAHPDEAAMNGIGEMPEHRPAGAEQASEKLDFAIATIPQGLKPIAFYWLHRHD
jgi:hypothetical protein